MTDNDYIIRLQPQQYQELLDILEQSTATYALRQAIRLADEQHVCVDEPE